MKHLLTLILALFSFAAFSQTVTNTIVLDGSDSKDDDGSITKYEWKQTGGTASTITNANTAKATVVFAQAGIYYYQFAVTDNDGATGTANVTVTVQAANVPPKAIIQASQITIKLPAK